MLRSRPLLFPNLFAARYFINAEAVLFAEGRVVVDTDRTDLDLYRRIVGKGREVVRGHGDRLDGDVSGHPNGELERARRITDPTSLVPMCRALERGRVENPSRKSSSGSENLPDF